ncbi:ATP-binding protein [Pseudovibrio sp. Tun.PSC04-5.I4]|uniref:sensor histidine kinase n=1 Tax=Pseudovibrio sp. Tun.PSC04-5.I4 TaxID=1798213 RepID=UPI000881F0FE|nr:ATP-binding protein [Pseudovibrio sp. Tun.PSC04-5.I4]SDQ89258.1 Signal transduction histidine kinase [Pseudovibrio sp. Tun.PSC04-5.I4]
MPDTDSKPQMASKGLNRWNLIRYIRKQQQTSLAWRLIFVAGLWAIVTLFVAGAILVALFREAGEKALDDRLDVHMTAIVSLIANVGDQQKLETRQIGDPRFTMPLSGWYWTVQRDGKVLYESDSLFGDTLKMPNLGGVSEATRNIIGPAGRDLRLLQKRIQFGSETPVTIAVAGSTRELGESTTSFAWQAATTLGVLGLGLIGAIFLQVRFGLRPLNELQDSFGRVRQGKEEEVLEDLPKELKPLAVELNALIHSNREVVEHSRTQVGNLAHALKTPLSVITNEARSSDDPLAMKVSEQADLMRGQVQHYLEKARMAAQRRVIGVSCEAGPIIARMARAMEKIHRDKEPEISVEMDEGLLFRGEQQDLEEILGNLLDNACKWCDKKVSVTLKTHNSSASLICLIVEDDGPGLGPEERKRAVRRGQRLDETVPGTGLGLSIVVDIAGVYGGAFELGSSKLGGLKATVTLPALSI